MCLRRPPQVASLERTRRGWAGLTLSASARGGGRGGGGGEESPAGGGPRKTRLDRLREGQKQLGSATPVSEQDVAQYSQIISSVIDAQEQELVPLVASNIDFLFSVDLATVSTQYRAK